MVVNKPYFKYLYFPFIFFLIIIQLISNINSALKCAPDFKSKGDNYSSLNDPQDNFEYFYGYEFAHRVGGEYYDHWKGIFWDDEPFCYDAYDSFTRPEKLSDLDLYETTDIDVVSNLDDAQGKDLYVLIDHEQTNLVKFHNKVCMTKQHNETKYNHGEYELLIKMDKYFEKEFLNTPYHFIFTIENPSNKIATFAFKARNFINTKEKIIIPEVFYFTENYTISPHKSRIINASLTFEKNNNQTEGGYFIKSLDKGKSKEPFYWPDTYTNNGKLKKLTNMEIILESDLLVGISSFSLMRRRNLEESSYLGNKCNIIKDGISNGKCGDGFFCNNDNKCERCQNNACKNCDEITQECTECFLISIDGQWNPPGGKGTNLKCDLDYIDFTKIIINGQNKIEVPPAIHWRVTMDFWIWISDTSVLSKENINMNIIYKDFIAFTLRCFPEGLRIYATPLEWLYEYPTGEGYNIYSEYYNKTIEPLIHDNVINFLKNYVGSYDEVTMEDLVKNATSNWVYIRYAFNLDKSKHYLNNLPESNLKVSQTYFQQSGMPFHFKKFYGINKMTYLLFQNFYHPVRTNENITIYLRNLNIFREYIPQNIITKYFNLHSIDSPSKFPQLLVSFPFSNLISESQNIYKMKGYNYYTRLESGEVEDKLELNEYNIVLDNNIKTLRPPRNFWRLNLLELNKQPETCDFDNIIDMKCESPNEFCFEDDKAFICIEGTEEQPYYLDINNLNCKDHCEIGYMHPPRYSPSKKRLYCSQQCDENNHQCPSDNYKYTEIHSNFLCSNNFFNLYYKCFKQDEALNNAEYSGIFFSSFLRTPSIYIELKNKYEQFGIDFWYFPDYWLRKRNYNDPLKNYEPKKISDISDSSRIIFLSDCCKIQYGRSYSDVVKFYVNNVETSVNSYTNSARIEPYNWNHFVLTYFKIASGTYSYYLTFKNSPYENYPYNNIKISYDTYWVAPAKVTLSKIVFCNAEENEVFGNHLNSVCKNAQWLDGYYRKLQIFDLKYSSRAPMFYTHHFENDGINEMIKHRYIFGLNSIIDNHLIDSISNANGYVPSIYNKLSYQNPDGNNYILYQSNYAPQGGIPTFFSNQYISAINYNLNKIVPDITSTTSNCLITQPGPGCLSCKEGYSLFLRSCYGNERDASKSSYYYKNPGKNMPDRLSLNLNFNKIMNEPYLTIFFFIKIYGFVKDVPQKGPVKLLIFHQEKNSDGILEDEFYLAYDHVNNQKLYFYVNGKIMFSLNEFRDYYFGIWIPISITAFREEDRRFKMNMVQASFLHSNWKLDSNYKCSEEDLFPYIKFTQFTITNTWVGLLSEIKIYNKFIVNAWGIIQVRHNKYLGSPIEEISLNSDSPNLCLPSNRILNTPSYGYKTECVTDYNPHIKICDPSCTEITRYSQISTCYRCCNQNTNTYPTNCIYGDGSISCGKRSEYYSCENQAPTWKYYFPTYVDRRIDCMRLSYIDYNRYKFAKAYNVDSPQNVWAIDFWFKTSTNQAVKERGKIQEFTSEGNNNNFNEFEIE